MPKSGQFLGRPFGTGQKVTQGDPVSTIILNIVVYAVVRAVLEEVFRPQEAQNGLGCTVGERNQVFYADDGQVAREGTRLGSGRIGGDGRHVSQGWAGDKLGKTKAMVYTLGLIWGHTGEEAYKRRATREGEKFQEKKCTRISC